MPTGTEQETPPVKQREIGEEIEALRVSKREFIARFAKRADVPVETARVVYDAMIAELLEIVGNGGRVTLTKFGRFYPQAHKGHRSRNILTKEDLGEVPDYAVLKFSATRSVNKGVLAPAGSAVDDDDEDDEDD